MDRTTAAARATRAAESKGHTLGEWGNERGASTAECTRCPHVAWIGLIGFDSLIGDVYDFGGNATLYLCRPSGKRGTLTHKTED